MIELTGIAWNHSRGFVPMVATAQRYEELHPEVRITWEKRSLQAFADAPLEDLASRYDLIIMDHPHTALASEAGILLPLDDFLPADFLTDQAEHSVGASHASYRHHGRQWTLATDAAAPIATWRQDLLQRHGMELPQTWEDVLRLARAGHVAVSLFPVDVLMHVYMFCDALGYTVFASGYPFAPPAVVAHALDCLKELGALCGPDSFTRNPIVTAEHMTRSDAAAYCPFAYGYSNYSRPGYAAQVLHAGGLVDFAGTRLRSTLGGAGLAISARTAQPQICAGYAAFTASAATQRGLYFNSGGQPGHRCAWTDAAVNAASNNFFRNTLATLDAAIVRPRHAAYMAFQDRASPLAHAAVRGAIGSKEAAAQLNQLAMELAISVSESS